MNYNGIAGTENMYSMPSFSFREYCGDATDSTLNRKTGFDRFLFIPEDKTPYSADHSAADKCRSALKGYLSCVFSV
ncbi:MAG: hypothetical protein IKF16_00860 [Lachnospiraceae bacterium]|nr:hypothetical protein [Lachnospiraceae bacterium]